MTRPLSAIVCLCGSISSGLPHNSLYHGFPCGVGGFDDTNECRKQLDHFLRNGPDDDPFYVGLDRKSVWTASVNVYLELTRRKVVAADHPAFERLCPAVPEPRAADNTLFGNIIFCVTQYPRVMEVRKHILRQILVVLGLDGSSTNFTHEMVNSAIDTYAALMYFGFPNRLVEDSIYSIWSERMMRYFHIDLVQDEEDTFEDTTDENVIKNIPTMGHFIIKPATIDALTQCPNRVVRIMDMIFVKAQLGLFSFQYSLFEMLIKAFTGEDGVLSSSAVLDFLADPLSICLGALIPDVWNETLWGRAITVGLEKYSDLEYLSYPGLVDVVESSFWGANHQAAIHGKVWFDYAVNFLSPPNTLRSPDLASSLETALVIVNEDTETAQVVFRDIFRMSLTREDVNVFSRFEKTLHNFGAYEQQIEFRIGTYLSENVWRDLIPDVVRNELADGMEIPEYLDSIIRGFVNVYLICRAMNAIVPKYHQGDTLPLTAMVHLFNVGDWILNLDQIFILHDIYSRKVLLRNSVHIHAATEVWQYMLLDSVDHSAAVECQVVSLLLAQQDISVGFTSQPWDGNDFNQFAYRFGLSNGLVGNYAFALAIFELTIAALVESRDKRDDNDINPMDARRHIGNLAAQDVHAKAYDVLQSRKFRLTVFAMYGSFMDEPTANSTREYGNGDLRGMKVDPKAGDFYSPAGQKFIRILTDGKSRNCFEYFSFSPGSALDSIPVKKLVDKLTEGRNNNKRLILRWLKKHENLGYYPCGATGPHRLPDSFVVPHMTKMNCDDNFLYLTCSVQLRREVVSMNRQQRRTEGGKVDQYCRKTKVLDIQEECLHLTNNYHALLTVAETEYGNSLFEYIQSRDRELVLPRISNFKIKFREHSNGIPGIVFMNLNDYLAEEYIFENLRDIPSIIDQSRVISNVLASPSMRFFTPSTPLNRLPDDEFHKKGRVSCDEKFALVTCEYGYTAPRDLNEQRETIAIHRHISSSSLSRAKDFKQLCDPKSKTQKAALDSECEIAITWFKVFNTALMGELNKEPASNTALSIEGIRILEQGPIVHGEEL